MIRLLRCLVSLIAFVALREAHAQSAKIEEKERPVVLVANPLGVPHGATTKVSLRGQRFDGATAVKTSVPGVDAKIVGQSNAAVPNMLKAEKVGDRQLDLELVVPAAAGEAGRAGEVELVVVTPKGESAPYKLAVGGEFPIVDDKEPNDGFAQGQPIAVPSIVSGAIHEARNVDVFAVEGKAGQKIVVEVIAARRGSALDAVLTLYDARGTVIAQNDDQPGTADARLETTLAASGRYLVVLQDANDLGGATHPYRLVVREGADSK